MVDTIKRVRRNTMTSAPRIARSATASSTWCEREIEGDFVECGVWRGGSMMAAAITLMRLGVTDRDLYLFDTFGGMPEPTAEDVDSPYDGYSPYKRWRRSAGGTRQWNCVITEAVRARDREHRLPPDASIWSRAWWRTPSPCTHPSARAPAPRHRLVRVHQARDGAPLSPPAEAGVLIVDDYGHYEGARRAVDEYFASSDERVLLHRIDYTGDWPPSRPRAPVGRMSSGPRRASALSVVAPVLNEEEILSPFFERVRDALAGIEQEIVLVDDGSSDSTAGAAGRPRRPTAVGVVHLSRNFGYQAAVTAGLDHARGDVVVTIDADLQDPPELIPELVERWQPGPDVVYAVREARQGERWVKLATARWFTKVFTRWPGSTCRHNVGDFRLMDRRAVEALARCPSATASCAAWSSGSATRRPRCPTGATGATPARPATAGAL